MIDRIAKALVFTSILGVGLVAADAWAARGCLREQQFETYCLAICDRPNDQWRCIEEDIDRCCIAGLDEFGLQNGTCGEKAWSDCYECTSGTCGF